MNNNAPHQLDFGPENIPSLEKMKYIVARAKENNFFWANTDEILEKIHEEIAEVKTATSPEHLAEEIGDALFTLACLAYDQNINAEEALHKTIEKLMGRWQSIYDMAQADGKQLHEMTRTEMDPYWQRTKKTG